MANRRALVNRRKAVRNVRKITRTMELIATAKFKKALERASQAAEYTRKIAELAADLAQSAGEVSHPLLEVRKQVRKVALFVITSNRGLCGGYNGGIIREADGRVRQLTAEGTPYVIEVSGKRGITFCKFRGIPIANSYTQFEDKPAFADVSVIADRLIAEYVSGKFDRIEVAYQRFENAARQAPVVETLLPFTAPQTQKNAGSTAKIEYAYMPDAAEILSELIPAAFKARLFKCFLDAAVGEQIARRIAMKAATENADELIRDLTMEYNRARQAQITKELAEIIGGAAALE